MDYFDSGFCVRTPSWHRKELLVGEHPTDWNEARKLAGLEWEPQSAPVYVGTGASGIGNVQLEGYRAITRSDTGAVLNVAADSYQLITHEAMGQLIEAFMGAGANVRFETAGSVKGGGAVWALLRLDEPWQVSGDESLTYPYLALLNAHDGSAACSFTLTSVRVVCWNTWSAADEEGQRTGSRYVIRHTGNMEAKVAEAKVALAGLRSKATEDRELFEALAQQPLSDAQLDSLTELFLPSPRDVGNVCTDRVHGNVLAARGAFRSNYDQSPTLDGLRGSKYGALQAMTEYLDHLRKAKTADSHLGRTVLRGEPLKRRALQLLEQV